MKAIQLQHRFNSVVAINYLRDSDSLYVMAELGTAVDKISAIQTLFICSQNQ